MRRALFIAFAVCTLWLMVENSILLVTLPRWWPGCQRAGVEQRHD